ncbi:MAG TPA: hypothetical protein PLX85_09595, partial [Dehalococcoidia bacterium]|nr:hypothetical protein [Dehalococcoidia bacterium]
MFVLGASTLAVAAGMTAVLLHKERLSRVNLTVESQKARADAQSGLEFALAALSADPAGTTWRSSSTLAFANKRYFGADASDITISLADPTDSDLTDSNLDPVVVSVSAVSGQCEQNYEMTLAPAQTPLSCLDFAVTVGGALSKVGTGNIYTSGAVSVGKAWEVDSDAKPSVIDALNTVALAMPVRTSPVTVFRPLAGGKTTTTTMSAQSLTVGDGSTTAGGGTNSRSGAAYDPETMEAMVPNTSDTIKYYRSIGTTINFSSLSSGAIRDCVLSAS